MAVIVKRITQMLLVLLVSTIFFHACEWGMEAVSFETGKLPNRVVYIANIDTQLDLTGWTFITTAKNGNKYEWPEDDRYSITDSRYIEVNHSIDFTRAGVYEVEIEYSGKTLYRFTIQVIDDEVYNALKAGKPE